MVKRGEGEAADTGRSQGTVVLAGVANLAIAAAKLVGGLATGSSALLSEAAHSTADTLNQGFLLAALRRSAKPADAQHPFGYGMERYFWSLLAAVAVFVLGAGFSVAQGIRALAGAGEHDHLMLGLGILGMALVFDGVSLVRALWQVRAEAADDAVTFRQRLRETEPTVRAVVFEDTAAVVGVVVAAIGLSLDHLTGTTVYDGIASLVIAAVLVAVAYTLGRQNQELLIGRAMDSAELVQIRDEIAGTRGIRTVLEVLTMRLAPDEVLVAARVELDPDVPGSEIEEAADQVEARIRQELPDVRHVFIDPTPHPERSEVRPRSPSAGA